MLCYISSSVYKFTHSDRRTDTGRDIVASTMKQMATKICAQNAVLDPVHSRKIDFRREKMFSCLISSLLTIFAAAQDILKVIAKKKPEKKISISSFNEVWSRELCDTGAALKPIA